MPHDRLYWGVQGAIKSQWLRSFQASDRPPPPPTSPTHTHTFESCNLNAFC